ncbi:uncharacterized protein [Lepeophtheirus salmonis]|uniref:uncharacterized protein n=1 Tax=Lepeophtheirus salmonis TaxID=72036 RepID=UPI001AE9FE73|nr:surface protein P113-like isoform X1 [Lepeophtheirus salmonis]
MHSIHKVSSTFIVMEYSYIFTISFLLVCVLWNEEVKGNPIVSCPTVDGETCVFPFVYDGETYDHCHFNDSHYLCATSQSNSTHPATSLSTCSVTCFGDATMLEKFHPKFVTENVMRALDDEPESMEDKMEEGETKDSDEDKEDVKTEEGETKDSEEDTEENKTEEGENNDSEEDTEDKETEEDENDDDSEDDKEDQSTEEDEMKDSEDDKEDQSTEEDEMKDSEEDKEEESKCKTLSEINCVFPFKFNGIEHTSCTYAGVGHYSWCATAVDPSNMEYTSYGFCSKDCEKEEIVPEDQCATFDGTKCEFPFTYNEQTYNECTGTDNSGLPWCATKVNDNMEHLEYGVCRSIC